MRRLTAAVLVTAAVAIAVAGLAVSAAADSAVRADVVLADRGQPLDVRRIRVIDGLRPGEIYRLPPFRIRNHRGIRTAYRLVVIARATDAERRAPRRWLYFEPAAAVVDAGRSRAVGVRLGLPDDAEPGAYAVVLGVRPGGSEAARLTFRIRSERTAGWHRQAANLVLGVVVLTLAAAVAAISLVRVVDERAGRKREASV